MRDHAMAIPGIHTTNPILIEFEIQWNFVMLLLITYLADHNEILHMSRQWHVQNFIVIGW